jgi:hypothetical protein
MSFPAHSLVAAGGSIYSHVFENTSTGLQRGHFWSLTIDFAPVEYDESEWDCSVMIEWMRFPVRDWRLLNDSHVAEAMKDELVEASFYLTRHDWATVKELTLKHIADNRFRACLKLVVDFQGFTGDDVDPEMEITAETDIEYTGIIVVPDNLFPKPNTPEQVMEVVSQFANPAAYHSPEKDDFRFMLRPV